MQSSTCPVRGGFAFLGSLAQARLTHARAAGLLARTSLDSLLRGIASWLSGSDAQSSRQLRHASTRLVENLRARSRGLPREAEEELALQARARAREPGGGLLAR